METAKDMNAPEPLEVDEERGISVLDEKAPPVSMSAVTFDGVSKTSQTTTGTRKIQKQDVKNVFRASTTRAPATNEQIRRIKVRANLSLTDDPQQFGIVGSFVSRSHHAFQFSLIDDA